DAGLQLAYGLYGFFALVSFVFVYFLVPETNGKQLEAMGEDALGHSAPKTARPSNQKNMKPRPTTAPDPV
ncbi:MAG TPA: hypothetical protein K8V94_05985, partial [Corynebacterium amycolatum]|nr:hypothetical protein [Corynebacterium amycolatum]